jgi:hypothetical protein
MDERPVETIHLHRWIHQKSPLALHQTLVLTGKRDFASYLALLHTPRANHTRDHQTQIDDPVAMLIEQSLTNPTFYSTAGPQAITH